LLPSLDRFQLVNFLEGWSTSKDGDLPALAANVPPTCAGWFMIMSVANWEDVRGGKTASDSENPKAVEGDVFSLDSSLWRHIDLTSATIR